MLLQPLGIVREGIAVTFTIEGYIEDDGRKVAGICGLKGKINLPPKAWLQAVREEVRRMESIARACGCDEMRVGGSGGRSWGRVLPDYQPHNGQLDIVKKRLT